jgi:hypothetical protein
VHELERQGVQSCVQSAPDDCTLTAITTAQGIQVKPGAIWARYECATVSSSMVATELCRVQGEVVLENCD